jgi:PAS domain S-box-containing protein
MKDAIQAAATAAMHRTLPPELFSGLLAIAADAVIAVDDEQRIIFFNEGAERIFGWTAAEIGGQFLEVLLPERYRAAHRGHVRGFGAAHGRARLMGERQEISGLRKSGVEFPAEAAIQRIEVDGRNVYAAVLRDISARQRAEDALHQAIQARDDMMGIVSHDLRNPANAVKMLARSILEGDTARRLTDDVVERLQVVRQAAEQMDALIQDLLDVTRLEAGRLTVSPEQVAADWLVSRSVEALRPLADASGVSLQADVSAEVPSLQADPGRMLQVLSNLVGNAIKFTPAGGAVRIRVGVSDGSVLFTVEDTGLGVAAEQLPRVFDRFFQVSSGARGTRHGAGLGLPIARGIVEAHGGRIWMDSEQGTGTTVQFTVPLR